MKRNVALGWNSRGVVFQLVTVYPHLYLPGEKLMQSQKNITFDQSSALPLQIHHAIKNVIDKSNLGNSKITSSQNEYYHISYSSCSVVSSENQFYIKFSYLVMPADKIEYRRN